jgi:hypothetical protein
MIQGGVDNGDYFFMMIAGRLLRSYGCFQADSCPQALSGVLPPSTKGCDSQSLSLEQPSTGLVVVKVAFNLSNDRVKSLAVSFGLDY